MAMLVEQFRREHERLRPLAAAMGVPMVMTVTTAVRMASRVMTARVMRAVAAHAAQRHRNEANGAQRESGQIQIHGLSVSREANKRYDRQACPIHLTLLGTAPDATPGGIVEGADAPT